jgi:hypothetical protein
MTESSATAKTNANVFVDIFIIILRERRINDDHIRRLVNIISMDRQEADLTSIQYLIPNISFDDLTSRITEDSIDRIFLVEKIWSAISTKMKLDLDTMIREIKFPPDYASFSVTDKCNSVKHVLSYLNKIHANLLLLMTFFTSIVRGLFNSYDDAVQNSKSDDKNVLFRKWPLDKLNNYTTKVMEYLSSELRRWAIDYLAQNSVRNGRRLPEMCYYGVSCIKQGDADAQHKRQFFHPSDECWLVGLKDDIKPRKSVRKLEPPYFSDSVRVKPMGGGKKRSRNHHYAKRTRTHRTRRRHRR